MPSRWFRVPTETISESGGYEQPKYADFGRAFKAAFEHPDGAPIWVVRIAADTSTLDTIAGKSDTTELSDTAVENALGSIWGETHAITKWNNLYDLSEYE